MPFSMRVQWTLCTLVEPTAAAATTVSWRGYNCHISRSSLRSKVLINESLKKVFYYCVEYREILSVRAPIWWLECPAFTLVSNNFNYLLWVPLYRLLYHHFCGDYSTYQIYLVYLLELSNTFKISWINLPISLLKTISEIRNISRLWYSLIE